MRSQLCIRKLSVLQKRNVDLGGKKADSHQRKQAISLETARAQAFVVPFSSSYPLSLPWLAQTVPQPLLPLPKGALVNHRRAAQATSPLGDPSCGCAALGKAEGQRGAPMGPPLFCATAQQRLGGTPPGTVPGQENNIQTSIPRRPSWGPSCWRTGAARFQHCSFSPRLPLHLGSVPFLQGQGQSFLARVIFAARLLHAGLPKPAVIQDEVIPPLPTRHLLHELGQAPCCSFACARGITR